MEYELYHYGVKGMKWGVVRQQKKIDKYRKKARQYDKYSKEYAKEGSRRYGSDGARQTDREIAWMKQLAADNKAKSLKYEAKADRALAKIGKLKAKELYKSRTDKAFKEYESSIEKIEKNYKRGQNLSEKDLAREAAAEKKYADTVAKAKADYKKARRS